jgi:hypothetical protein
MGIERDAGKSVIFHPILDFLSRRVLNRRRRGSSSLERSVCRMQILPLRPAARSSIISPIPTSLVRVKAGNNSRLAGELAANP